MDKILISIFSAVLGFALSQSFNLVNFVRRPRFRAKNYSDGIISSYTGDPPDTPWEIELGFYLENHGRNVAKNTRIFVSDFRTSSSAQDDLELSSLELFELKRPIDLIPPGESVGVTLGVITSDTFELALSLHPGSDERTVRFSDAETRRKRCFSAKFHVICDDRNSFKSIDLVFNPEQNDWASALLKDYDDDENFIPAPLKRKK